MNRGPVAEINLAALEHNLKITRNITREKQIIAVVKADAYGHGAIEISRKLLSLGVTFLAVAYTEEARTLREAGIRAKILVLFDCTEKTEFFSYDLIPVISTMKDAEDFSRLAADRGKTVPVHVKIDTGMGRTGFIHEDAVSRAVEIAGMQGIVLEGILSHFSEADLSDRSFTVHQLELFNNARSSISKELGRPLMSHMANSAAILSLEGALFDAVRPGLMLYGYSPFSDDYGLLPVMNIKTRILAVRDLPAGTPISYGRTFITKRKSRVAVMPLGYADGFNRLFSNNADVLVRGRRVPVIGKVCMDLTMIDVTDIEDASEDDEVIIVGRQGTETITAHQLAVRCNTIPYEILTSLGNRAKKEYIH